MSDREKYPERRLGEDIAAELTWWTAESGPLNQLTSWQKVRPGDFQKELIRAVADFPLVRDLDPLWPQSDAGALRRTEAFW